MAVAELAKRLCPQGEADDVVNAIWSLQYSVPGCVCGSGGTIVSQLVPTGAPTAGVADTGWLTPLRLRLVIMGLPSTSANSRNEEKGL